MTDKQLVVFRQNLAQYLLFVSEERDQSEVMAALLRLESVVDKIVDTEIAKVMGTTVKLRTKVT